MINGEHIVYIIVAYLLGSVPSAVWIGQIFYGIDVREYGSGNAGATNTFRVLGKKAGIPVLLIDIFKGYCAVNLPLFFGAYIQGSVALVNLQLAIAVAALLGHIFPLYVGFRGGKGIATLLGIVLAVDLYAALSAIVVFILVLSISKYVSLSSMIASIVFPVVIIVIEKTQITSLVVFSLFIAIMVLITHQKNIERLMRGEESKIFKKSTSSESDSESEDDFD